MFNSQPETLVYDLRLLLSPPFLPPSTRVSRWLQSDASKVESVQDVLARAAAKGLLGGVLGDRSQPGQSRTRLRRSRAPPANRKLHSPGPTESEAGSEPVAGRGLDLDPAASRPVATDTPLSAIERSGGGDEEEEAADEEEEDVEEGSEGMAGGGGRDVGEGLRRKAKGRAKAKRRTRRSRGKAAEVSAVQPPLARGKTINAKVKPTRGQGRRRRAVREQFVPTPSLTSAPALSAGPSEAPTRWSVPRPAARTPVTPATHTLQMSRATEQRGKQRKAYAKKPTKKKAGEAGSVSEATGGAGTAGEEARPRDRSPPVDPVQPLVSSLSRSSLSDTLSASSQSVVPSSSSSTMSSTPSSVVQSRTFF